MRAVFKPKVEKKKSILIFIRGYGGENWGTLGREWRNEWDRPYSP